MVKVGTRADSRRSIFGDVALLLFLLAQALDGVLTYVGVSVYGMHVEGNPIIGWLMTSIGEGPALAAAKLTAGFFGIALHLSAVHKAVAVLAAFYLAVAVLPWIAILFYF
jgi:uncharacterized membrane protein